MPPSPQVSKPLSHLDQPRLTWVRGVDLRHATAAWTLQFGSLEMGEASPNGWKLYMLSPSQDPRFPAETMEQAMLDMRHWFRGLGFSVEPLPLDVLEGS